MKYIHDKITHNKNAAREILPLVFKMWNIRSILDIGCGLGTWLAVSKELGIESVVGVDGDWINNGLLEIENEEFITFDLSEPFNLNKKFDLVISLEVAEHIQENSADLFIETLVQHADIILFSAAIKNQGGQNHLNEQNPEYWSKKFKVHGFEYYDILRPLIWNNRLVEYWYKQNVFLVARKGVLDKKYFATNEPLTLVHPELLYYYQQPSTNQVIQKLGLSKGDIDYILGHESIIKLAFCLAKRLLKRSIKHS